MWQAVYEKNSQQMWQTVYQKYFFLNRCDKLCINNIFFSTDMTSCVSKKMPKIDTLDALEEHEEHEDDYQTNSNW